MVPIQRYNCHYARPIALPESLSLPIWYTRHAQKLQQCSYHPYTFNAKFVEGCTCHKTYFTQYD